MESNPTEDLAETKPETKVEEITTDAQTEQTEDYESKVEEKEENSKDEFESAESKEETQKLMMDYFEKMQAMGNAKDPKSQKIMQEIQKYKTLYDKHEFWDTQPVPKGIAGGVEEEGEIEKGKLDEVRQEPYALPTGFTWSNINLEDESDLNEVYELLRDHYVEDSDHMFRFDYQKEFLKWALLPPKQFPDWICGVRGGKANKLFGMITGVPVKLVIKGKMVKMTEINFL
jgi:glycylpeptide N-tetradecanoyltransferase